MTEGVFWFADTSDEEDQQDGMPWQPFLQIVGGCFPLPIWFGTKEECEAFIATIPPGDDPGMTGVAEAWMPFYKEPSPVSIEGLYDEARQADPWPDDGYGSVLEQG